MCLIKVRKDSLQALLSLFHDIKSSQMNANIKTLLVRKVFDSHNMISKLTNEFQRLDLNASSRRVTLDQNCSVVNLKVEIRSYFQKYVSFVAAYKWWPIFMYSSCAA